ncbi:17596_t:CDS:1, partial [Entrophospora sp. SA101]
MTQNSEKIIRYLRSDATPLSDDNIQDIINARNSMKRASEAMAIKYKISTRRVYQIWRENHPPIDPREVMSQSNIGGDNTINKTDMSMKTRSINHITHSVETPIVTSDIQIKRKKLGGIVTENQNLQFENARKAISLANFKSENDIKSKKIRSLESMIEILEGKLTSAQGDVISIQNDSSKKESENLSLKSKIAELDHIKSSLESKVNELEHLKSEAISKPIVGGDDGKNITKSDNISLGSTDLSKYFICGKNMDPIEKIDGEITELSKNDTEIIPKVIDEIDISETNNNILQEIPNMTTYLAQPENNVSSLIESNTQMGPGPEALPLSAVASTLMSPLSAYIFLILLIIAVMWFMVLRRTWDIGKK